MFAFTHITKSFINLRGWESTEGNGLQFLLMEQFDDFTKARHRLIRMGQTGAIQTQTEILQNKIKPTKNSKNVMIASEEATSRHETLFHIFQFACPSSPQRSAKAKLMKKINNDNKHTERERLPTLIFFRKSFEIIN